MSSSDDPFETIERMFRRMQRQFGRGLPAGGVPGGSTDDLGWMGVDLADEGEAFVVTADLPGFEKEDVDLRVTDDALFISASRERAEERQEGTYLRSERRGRTMRERVRLPEPVDEDAAEATLKNGVLTVHLPKSPAEETGHQVEIE